MPLLEIENLVVEFTTASGPFRAVDGVSLSVEQREVMAIVGESGSGKSVSMLAVMGLLPAAAALIAMLIFIRYPLSDDKFREIRDETEARKAVALEAELESDPITPV